MKDIINFKSKFSELETVNPLITKYRINICVPDVPANNYIFSKEVIEGMASTICGSGVYAYYFEKYDQLGGHSDDIIRTPYGYVKTPQTQAYGFSDPYKMPYWMKIDGENWFCADVYIWTGINPEIEDILNNSVVYQSMQVAVDEEQEGQYKVVKDAVFLGFCLLQGIEPAYIGSTITKFSLDDIGLKIDTLSTELNQLKQEYDSIMKFSDDKKQKIEIDNTKDSATDGEWSNPGKKLYEPILEASNKISLINEAYLIHEDGYEDSPSEKLKYPHHVIRDDKLVLHISGVQSAFARVKQQGLTGEPIDHIKRHYEELGLNMDNFSEFNLTLEDYKYIFSDTNNNQEKEVNKEVIKEAMEKFSLTSRQVDEILSNALSEYKYQCGEYEYRKYWVRTYDDELVYVCDYEDDKTYSFKYTIVDNVATIDIESKDEVIDGGFISVNSKENEVVEMAKEKQCSEELSAEEMSSNEYVDNPAMQELNDKSAEDNKELAEENLENPEEVNASEEVGMSEEKENVEQEDKEDKDTVIMSLKQEMSDLQEKFSKIETDMNTCIEENTQLKKFKTDIEKQNKEFSVESTLKEVINILPSEEVDACRLSAEKFSLEDIDIWKNEVKAKAFNFSKGITEKKPFIQVAFPNSEKPKSGNGLWD